MTDEIISLMQDDPVEKFHHIIKVYDVMTWFFFLKIKQVFKKIKS